MPVMTNDARVGLKGMRRLEGAGAVLTLADCKTLAGVGSAAPNSYDELVLQPQGGDIFWTDNGSTPTASNGSGWKVADGEPFKYPGDDYAALKFYVPASCYVVLWFGSMTVLKNS